ncbi:MAG TPA: homoserine dehydrogenase, partial [Alphaproteobacteria bacterium]|nr:homoserine dehydrogenase [Alphaproteobacteria bacterium]
GAGTVRLLRNNADVIAARAGRGIKIKAVAARDKNKKRDCDLSGVDWADDPLALAQRPDVDVVVELIGGAEGVARKLAEAALKNGKHLVTANKALLAVHGAGLAHLAETSKRQLNFEAAVAGGIPVIKALRGGMAGNHIAAVRGILNGTCNYILTRMEEAGLDFAVALKEAQDKGYAEADPAADIDGHDTAHKIALLAALAFGAEPDVNNVRIEGIRHLTALDLQFAGELGCRVKLLGIARLTAQGLEQRVAPALVPKSLPLAQVMGSLNAVLAQGDFVGDVMLEGRGAGADATASAVVADIIDIARGNAMPAFGVPAAQLKKLAPAGAAAQSRTYMRLQVVDKPGVVADISAILRDEAVSIESLIQRGRSQTSVPVVMTTHAAPADAMRRAADKIAKVGSVVEKPVLLPIED